MKRKFSVSFKLTLIVVFISVFIFISMSYLNIKAQTDLFEESYSEKAEALAQALDASIGSYNQLYNKEELLNEILGFIYHNDDVLMISVNLPENDSLEVFVSSNSDLAGIVSSYENQKSYKNDTIIKISEVTGDSHLLTVIAPIHLSGQVAGTYEILFSLDEPYATLSNRTFNLVLVTLLLLSILIISFLLLIRVTVIKPINMLKEAIDKISKGDLETRISVSSHDEFAELADSFNKMTKDLNDKTKDVKRLLKEKDVFIYQMGHDLKTPLTPLTTLLPIVKSRVKDEKLKEMLDVVIKNAYYMKNLVIKTLQLALINSPKAKFEFEKINLSEEINQVLQNKSYELDQNKINVQNQVDKDFFVYADKIRIQELLDNLISNSIKYIQNEKGNIIINAKKEKDMVIVSIKDNGIGMTKEQLTHVFDEFYKADYSRHDLKSTGLGLSICKSVVEKHGGKIWAESPGENKGTTVYFSLMIYDNLLRKNN